MLAFQIIIYDNHRKKIHLFQKDDNCNFGLPLIKNTGNLYGEHYEDFIIEVLEEKYGVNIIVERLALLQFDTIDNYFCMTFVVKETKHNADLTWFDINNLPENIDELSMRALRAEMQDVTYEICEYTKSE